jgi:hypothetical protein
MLNRSAKTATYREDVAKIALTLPDELLERIEIAAQEAGETREAFLRRIADEKLKGMEDAHRKMVEAKLGPPVPMGGDSAQLIREMRDGRVPPVYRKDSR